MSDDLVNQLTLNCLISKEQLQKLNKKNKNSIDELKCKEIKKYCPRIEKLFADLLVCSPPDDLLLEVKTAFDYFVEKSIYYFKVHDSNLEVENERNGTILDDIDFDKEERDIDHGNYIENNNYNKEDDEEENNEEDEEEDEEDNDEEEVCYCATTSPTVTNWFQTVKQTNKQHTIFPRNQKKQK